MKRVETIKVTMQRSSLQAN